MFDKKTIIDDYERYLKDERVSSHRVISEFSIRASYLPFVRGKIIDTLLKDISLKVSDNEDFFDAFFNANKETKGRLIDLLDGEAFPIKPKNKTESNYKSYLKAFCDFLHYRYEQTPEDNVSLNDADNYPDFKLDHKTILGRFISRFRTQDRVYDKIMFPCRVFGKLFDKKQYRSLLIDACERIKFHTSDGGTVMFKDVESLTVVNGVVSVKDNVGNHCVVTERFDDEKKSKGFYPFPKPSFRNFSIDHELSLNGMMLGTSFPALDALTNKIHELEKKYGEYNFKSAPAIGDELESLITSQEKAELFGEVEQIYKDMSFSVMDQGENSRKNNSV